MAYMRHLTEHQMLAALGRGASIEQMLTSDLDESGTISWLHTVVSGSGFALRLHHVLDDGNDDFFDVSEFRSVDEDEYLGEGRLVGEYPNATTMLEAATRIGARMDRWVNESVIEAEYANLRAERDSPRPLG